MAGRELSLYGATGAVMVGWWYRFSYRRSCGFSLMDWNGGKEGGGFPGEQLDGSGEAWWRQECKSYTVYTERDGLGLRLAVDTWVSHRIARYPVAQRRRARVRAERRGGVRSPTTQNSSTPPGEGVDLVSVPGGAAVFRRAVATLEPWVQTLADRTRLAGRASSGPAMGAPFSRYARLPATDMLGRTDVGNPVLRRGGFRRVSLSYLRPYRAPARELGREYLQRKHRRLPPSQMRAVQQYLAGSTRRYFGA